MTAIGWQLPDPTDGGMWIENPSRSGGVAINGQEQNVGTASPRLRAQWTIPLRNAAEITQARRTIAKLRGKANSVLMPIFEPKKGRTGNVQAAAALRATTIDVTLTTGPAPEHGRHFGIANSNRVYIAIDITHVSGSHYQMTFQPPLRVAADIGDTVHWDDALLEMNLTEDQTPIPLTVMRYATLDLSLVEAW